MQIPIAQAHPWQWFAYQATNVSWHPDSHSDDLTVKGRIANHESGCEELQPLLHLKTAISKRGWPSAIKTFRTKRDAQD